MDGKALAGLKRALEAEREHLAAEIAEYELADQETLSDVSGENNYRDHMADQGSATFARELDMTLEENAREKLKRVEHSLERVASGEYGVCRRCGVEIPISRLEAMPTAELCIECKEWEESR